VKNVENETQTLYDLDYGEKTDEKGKSETYMVGPRIWRETLKNVENETHTLGPGIWQEKRQRIKMQKTPGRTRNKHIL
jgi:hypothetical protein